MHDFISFVCNHIIASSKVDTLQIIQTAQIVCLHHSCSKLDGTEQHFQRSHSTEREKQVRSEEERAKMRG